MTQSSVPSNIALFFDTLDLASAPDDATRAVVLAALEEYAGAIKNEAMQKEARARMPAADPFDPPQEWERYYSDGFCMTADLNCGVDKGECYRYCREYWQMFSDEDRQKRLEDPKLGFQDGIKDANILNDA